MLANDTFTYSRQAVSAESWTAKLQELALLSLERSQKLDLLIHLLNNLGQSLVVCGAPGIGKTTMLDTLARAKKEHWRICRLQGSEQLSYESIISQLADFLRSTQTAGSSLAFNDVLAHCAQMQQKIILVIDDAGSLVAGLINTLNEFATGTPGFRLVLSMTYDQFHTKANTDKTLDDCHVIEIPPLAQKHYRAYLQALSSQPDMALAHSAISDALIERLYEKTDGIPGKILAELPKYASKNPDSSRFGFWLVLLILIAGAGVAAWQLTTSPEPLVTQNMASSPAPLRGLAPSPQGSTSADSAQPQPVTATQPEPLLPSAPQNPVPPSLPALENQTATAPLKPVTEAQPHEPLLPPPVIKQPAPAALEPEPKADLKPAAKIKAEEAKPLVSVANTVSSQPAPAVSAVPQPQVPAVTNGQIQPLPTPAVEQPATTNAAAEPKAIAKQQVPEPSPVAPSVNPVDSRQDAKLENKNEAKPMPQAVQEKSTAKAAGKPPVAVSAQVSEDQDWIMAQSPDDYTLQVMVLSSKASVQRFINRYSDYRNSLKYYVIGKPGQEKFALIYGAFKSSEEALQFKSSLPGEFASAVSSRFGSIQKKAKN